MRSMIGSRRRGRGSALVLAVAVLAAGCGRTSSSSPLDQAAPPTQTRPTPNGAGAVVTGPEDNASLDGGTLTYGIEAEPEGLDPTRYVFSQAGNVVASAVFDPLATLDADGKAVPYLATAFEPSADFQTWTIVLPAGVTFHDDTPVTADAVARDLEAYDQSLIIGPAMKGWFASATATDATHVEVRTSHPFRILPEALATQIGYVFAPSMLTNTDLAKAPVGSGPFVFQTHIDGRIWSFKKNPRYRTTGLPHLDRIDFAPIPDDAKRLQSLRDGDIDVLQTVGDAHVDELQAPDTKVVESQRGDKAFLMLNTSQPPFDRLTARQAIAAATDATGWRAEVYGNAASPINGPFTAGQPGYLADNGYPGYDPDRAKALVAQYRAETGTDLTFTFLAASDTTNTAYAQYFLPAFQAAGMKVTIEGIPQINLLAKVATGSYQMSQFRLFSNPDPRVDQIFYHSSSIGAISLDFPRSVRSRRRRGGGRARSGRPTPRPSTRRCSR